MAEVSRTTQLTMETKINLLDAINKVSQNVSQPKSILDLAMAYAIVTTGKLPGETPKAAS